MRDNPLISIIMVTMNHEKFIEKACQSAISQTYKHIEIIFLDNNSSDKTFEIAEETLANSEFPVKLIKNKESFGVAKNLNILISHASGEYVSILSGDDWYTNDSIEQKVKFILKNKVDFALSDGYKYIHDENKTIDAYDKHLKNKIIKSVSNFFHENVTGNEPINVGVIVKKQILEQHPFDEEIHAEDWDMNLRLTSLGYKIGFIDKKLFYYRILSKSLSNNWKLMDDAYRKITQKYMDYISSDKQLLKKYKVNLLKHKFELSLSEATSEAEKESIRKNWKIAKYRIKYQHPVLFFKLLISFVASHKLFKLKN